jgi:hypothetical protein
MRSSCIRHPEKHPLVIIHQWQLEFCAGDTATAALLSYFEYWHNVKLAKAEEAERINKLMAERGVDYREEVSLLHYQTEGGLIDGIMHITKTPAKIRDCLRFLQEAGVIEICPSPRGPSDRTRHFLFHPEAVNAWLNERYPPPPMPAPAPEEQPQELEEPAEVTEKSFGMPVQWEAWKWAQDHEFWCGRITKPAALRKNLQIGKPFYAQFMSYWRGELKRRNQPATFSPLPAVSPTAAGPPRRLLPFDEWDKRVIPELIRSGFVDAIGLRAFQGEGKVIITGPRVVLQTAAQWREKIESLSGQPVELRA